MPTKRKTVKKSSTTHRKQPRQHPKHFLKVYWPYIPILAVVTFGMLFSSVNPQKRSQQPATLAYATEMGVGALLSGTNTQRANNGLGALGLNSKLNSSAQAKANDMVSKDYWAHNSPNGDEPWVFFDAAGYNYQKAGENLAYGFSTSNETIIGWMNSPSHRANILDTSYTEVGFGFANSPNFVGTGQETVVVAHYGKPVGEPAPAPAPVAPAPTVAETTKPQALPASESSAGQQKVPVETTEEAPVVEEVAKPEPFPDERYNQAITSDNPVPDEIESKNITRLQRLTGGNAPWSAIALSVVSFSIVALWLAKHAILVKRYVLRGEHFVAHHPLLDLVVVTVAAIAVYLSQSSGVVL